MNKIGNLAWFFLNSWRRSKKADTRMIYLGKLYYGYEKPGRYGQDATRNLIAYAFVTGPKRMRLEFPAPQYESLLDVMELERQ